MVTAQLRAAPAAAESKEVMMKQNNRHKKQGLFRKGFMLALLAGAMVTVTAAAADGRQQLRAAERLDHILVKAPDQKAADFVIADATVDSVTLTWKKAADAQTYYISYWESGKPSTAADREDLGDVSSCVITGLKQAKYMFQIQPANKLHTGIPLKGAVTSVEGAPAPSVPVDVQLNHAKTGYCSLAFGGLENWYRSEAEVCDASASLIESSEGDCAGAVVQDDGIRDNGFYGVRVRGFYDQAGGTRSYGDWSQILYFPTAVKPLKIGQKNGKVTVKWPQVQGAEQYTVYVSKNASRGFQKALQTEKTAATVTKYGGAKLKPGKTYYIKVTAGMTKENESYTVSSAAAKIKIK